MLQGLGFATSHLFWENSLSHRAATMEKVTLYNLHRWLFPTASRAHLSCFTDVLLSLNCLLISHIWLWSGAYWNLFLTHILVKYFCIAFLTKLSLLLLWIVQVVIKGWHERWSQEHDGGNGRNDCASIGQREFGMLHYQMWHCSKELLLFTGGEHRYGKEVKSSNLRMKRKEMIRDMLDSSRRKVGT